METTTIDLPTMYGDHHVAEVRRILLAMPGVEEVYASSAFHVVRVRLDPDKISADTIMAGLGEAGYLGELPVQAEVWQAGAPKDVGGNFFRHTAIHEQVKNGVSFAQNVAETGRPLWPCPGLGGIKKIEEEA